MKAGVVVFPGSNCDQDCYHVLKNVVGADTEWLWHKDGSLPDGIRLVVLPGGFTYGDYLRVGAIARTSPIMKAVREFAERGGLVIGICNGFQILTECRMLPGALLPNNSLRFICKTTPLRVEKHAAPWTDFDRDVLRVPIAHGDGNYFIDPEGLRRLEENGQVLFRYSDASGNATDESNPNGSVHNIAGIVNERGNVLGMMPHPERCSEEALGNTDGRGVWESVRRAL